MAESSRGKNFSALTALLLCSIFLVLGFGLALMSGGVYRQIVDWGNGNYTQRTALSYLVNQLRRGDACEGIAVDSFEGHDALIISDGAGYLTYIYCCDGELRELYMEQGAELTAADGIGLLPLDELTLSAAGGGIVVTVTDNRGQEHSVTYTPRSGIREAGEV